jgi:hypothetical protein
MVSLQLLGCYGGDELDLGMLVIPFVAVHLRKDHLYCRAVELVLMNHGREFHRLLFLR